VDAIGVDARAFRLYESDTLLHCAVVLREYIIIVCVGSLLNTSPTVGVLEPQLMWSEWRCWRQVSRQRTVFTPGHSDIIYYCTKMFSQNSARAMHVSIYTNFVKSRNT
jgi:hypothetical protein